MLFGCVIVRIVAGSIEQMLVDVFKQHVIVSVIRANSNQNRTGLSFAKIPAGCEINSLHTFLNSAVCYFCA